MATAPDIPELDRSALSGVRVPAADRSSARIAMLLVVPLALLLVSVLLVFYVFFTATRVDGESMMTTLRPDDRVLVTKSYATPVRGDVVVASVLEEDGLVHDVIKRIAAVPGDQVEVRDDVAYVNGQLETFPGVTRVPGNGVTVLPFTVPAGQVYLLGDNRPVSYDSRYIGPVPASDIRGKAVAVYAPLQRMRIIH